MKNISQKGKLIISLIIVFSLAVPITSMAFNQRSASIESNPPTVDGIVDESYGPVIATDPAGDCQGGNPVDLTNLWVTQDDTYYFFAFEVNTDLSTNIWGKYAIYFDTTGDANGATSDAWGRAVTVSDPHKPEFAAYTYLDDGTYGAEDTQLYSWDGSAWASIGTVSAAAIGPGTTSIVEWAITKAALGSPDQLWIEVWSTGGGGGDNAQDTLNFPSDDWNAPDWSTQAELSVSTPVMVVDGVIEAMYGAALAIDPAGDGNSNSVMDLLDLYVTEDASQYYFAYTINANIVDTNWGKYALYIDTTNDTNGATSDAWGRNVVVNDPHKPEFGLYTWVDAPPYGPDHTNFVAWTGSAWDWANSGTVNEAVLVGGTPSVIEWAVEKNRLGNPEEMWMEVWDTGGGGGDNAQDTINDPADDWNATDWATQSILSNSTYFATLEPPPQAGHDDTVWWAELGHNSRDTLYRSPGGPVPTGTDVTLRLRAASGDLTEAKVRVWNDRTDTQLLLPMSIAYDDGTYEWWQAVVPASADPTVYWYRFIAIDGTDTDYYEDDAARTMGWGQAFDETLDYSYQLTVYDPTFETPEWIKNAVVYQIFPDRFRDGDATNNKPAGTFFYDEQGGTVYRSLDAEGDWNTAICDPRGDDACAGTYSKNFYGGDLSGLMAKLDYLQALGVNTIYLNPIFESPSNHGYDTTDYMAINPMFGTQAEFEALVTALNTRGMYLILDGVFNHVSSDSIYFDRYERYTEVGACESATSPYRGWFYFTDVPAGTGPCVGSDGTAGGATYESWWGYDSLPKMDSSNPDVRALVWEYETNALETVAGYYMQYADGWRLDVGADVDPGTINDPTNDYWEGFRNTVKFVNPDGYITGEEWGIANAWLLGGEWDAVMNYQFSSAVLSLWRDEPFVDNDHADGTSAGALNPISPEQFDERMLNLMERYAPEAFAAMLNLFGSHDTNRALFMLDHNSDLNDPTLYQNPAYDWSDAIERLKGAVLVQMTMPGAPTIYYGDEVGLVGPMAYANSKWEDDPYNRQPFPWLDASGTPYYTHLQSQPQQDAIYDYYATLTEARNANSALRTGDYRTLLVDNDLELYAYGRNLPGMNAAVVVINRGNTAQLVDLDVLGYLPIGETFQDIFTTTEEYTVDSTGKLLDIDVPANSGTVLVHADAALAAPPAPATDLIVSFAGADYADLGWTASADADSYLVYRSYLSGGGYELVGETSGSTFTDSGLTPGVRVYYIVIAKDSTTGLLSTPSNEAYALPAYQIGWANLQWPYVINHTIGINPTENIYGQVWISGVTLLPGATPGLWAQVGLGPDGSLPENNPEWTWVDAVFNGQSGENDEFMAQLLPEVIGTYDYCYRYSTNLGESWYYADQNGGEYSPESAGHMVVSASDDTTAPSAPVLSIADWSASFISLEWTASIDDVAVYAYDIYRSEDLMSVDKIARVYAPELSYTDDSVETGITYYYTVMAVDTSFNFSLPSNEVSQTAEPKTVAVTFEVTVPDFTPGTVFLTRYINPDGTVGDWNPAATALTQVSNTLWTATFDILDDTVMAFKFTRGSWDTVMKGADGNEELTDLSLTIDYGTEGTQLYQYTVLNWRDPIVTAFTPEDAAVDVALDSVITATWSQSMVSNTCLTLRGPEGAVSGSCTYDDDTWTVTFTPMEPLIGAANYTVTINGHMDAGGDFQQVDVIWTFRTIDFNIYLPIIVK